MSPRLTDKYMFPGKVRNPRVQFRCVRLNCVTGSLRERLNFELITITSQMTGKYMCPGSVKSPRVRYRWVYEGKNEEVGRERNNFRPITITFPQLTGKCFQIALGIHAFGTGGCAR